MKKKAWDLFQDITKIKSKIDKAFPAGDQKEIRDRAMDFAKLLGQNIRQSEMQDADYVEFHRRTLCSTSRRT